MGVIKTNNILYFFKKRISAEYLVYLNYDKFFSLHFLIQVYS